MARSGFVGKLGAVASLVALGWLGLFLHFAALTLTLAVVVRRSSLSTEPMVSKSSGF